MATEEEELESKISYENYKIWKKHVPYLYDVMVTSALEWPSLTVQWLPDCIKVPSKEHSERRLIMGTHTSDDEPNYLLIAKVQLPGEDKEPDSRIYSEDNEAGGYGNGKAKIEVVQKILHKGEVNRARYMPLNPSIIASKGPNAEVYIFDYTRHPSQPKEGGDFRPDLTLAGHDEQGYGLSWCPHMEGRLLSGSEDGLICTWDVQAQKPENGILQPKATYRGHQGAVEDVQWSVLKEGVFGSVGEDRSLMIWDAKDTTKPTHSAKNAHSAEVTCISFSPFEEPLILTGSTDMTVRLWDIRKLSTHLHEYEGHQDAITGLQWHPTWPEVFVSTGADKRAMVWNNSRIGEKQSKEASREGPPELMFVHAGHLSRISDVCWDPNDAWMVSTVAEDNMLHVWSMDQKIHSTQEHASMVIE